MAAKTFVKISVGSLPERRSEGVILHQAPIFDENWSINVNHQPPIFEENQNWSIFHLMSKWHPGYIIWEKLTDITGANLNAIMPGEHQTKPGSFSSKHVCLPDSIPQYIPIYPIESQLKSLNSLKSH